MTANGEDAAEKGTTVEREVRLAAARRAEVLRVLTEAQFEDGGRVLSDSDALVLSGRVIGALAVLEGDADG